MKDDGYKPLTPGDNDRGYHRGHAIEKPLARGSLDNGDRGTAMPHATMAGKVMPTGRAAPPANEFQGPAITGPVPIAERTMTGNMTRDWPTAKPAFTYHGKGPR